jgi:hypothetical protein
MVWFRQCCDPDPESSLDPDSMGVLGSLSGSAIRIRNGTRSRRAKMTNKKRKKIILYFNFLKCWMFSF